MGCDEIRDLLALVAGGEAGDSERIAVEAHLPTCRECSSALEEYRELRGVMAGMKEGEAPSGTIESIWPAVRDAVAPRRAVRFGAFEWAVRVAAVLIIGVALGYSASSLARPAAEKKAPEVAAPGTAFQPGGPAMNAGSGGPWFNPGVDLPVNIRPRKGGGTKADGSFHLPRVEKILDPDEADF